MQRWRMAGLRSTVSTAMALCLAAAIGLSCAMPQMIRNWCAYGDLFSGEPKHAMTTEGLTPRLFAVNVAKHVATHLAWPVRVLNAPMERTVRQVSGAAVEDPRIHYTGWFFPCPFKVVSTLGKDVPFVSNPLHVLLFGIALVVWLVKWKKARALLLKVGVPVVCGAMLYCAVFKWQPWSVRLTLPLYGWMAVGVGVWAGEQEPRRGCGVFGLLGLCAVAQALIHPLWFMPSFLFGEGTATSGITYDMTVGDKVRRLGILGWPKKELASMRATAPKAEQQGYSLFFTARQRQYFGNETYQRASWRHQQLEDAMQYVAQLRAKSGLSKTIGLLIASDHSNLPPEGSLEPFPYEYPMWTWGGGEAGRGDWRFAHFGVSDPVVRVHEIFGVKGGIIVSDQTRERMLERLRVKRDVTLVVSNAVLSVYKVGPTR